MVELFVVIVQIFMFGFVEFILTHLSFCIYINKNFTLCEAICAQMVAVQCFVLGN